MSERCRLESMLYSSITPGQSYPYPDYHPAQPPNQYMVIQYSPPPPPLPPYGYDDHLQYYGSSTTPDPGHGQGDNHQSQLAPPSKAKPKKPKKPKKSKKSVKQTSYKVCSNRVSQSTEDNHKTYNITIKYSFRDLSHAEDKEGKEEVGIQYGRRDLKEEQEE
ncbi:hypothetical protein ACFX2B_012029 [Malus domestica]